MFPDHDSIFSSELESIYPIWKKHYSSLRNIRDFSCGIHAQSDTSLHREYNLAMKNKSRRWIALRAQRKALTRRARHVKNAEAFLNFAGPSRRLLLFKCCYALTIHCSLLL